MSKYSQRLLTRWQMHFERKYERKVSLAETEQMVDRVVALFDLLATHRDPISG